MSDKEIQNLATRLSDRFQLKYSDVVKEIEQHFEIEITNRPDSPIPLYHSVCKVKSYKDRTNSIFIDNQFVQTKVKSQLV
jgi:hypothetical protein